jgi:hypothetical protein
MKILTAAQLRKLTTNDLNSLYTEVVRIRDASDSTSLERHETTHYAPRINKERIRRIESELQAIKDETLIELEKQQTEQQKIKLAQAQKNLDTSSRELKKLKVKVAKLQENYDAKYGSRCVD